MIDYKLIGSRIKNARKNKGITQANLSEILNVSPEYISRLECAATKISLETLCKIAILLDVTPEFLLTGALEEANNYLLSEIAENLKKCSPDKTKVILQIIKSISNL